MFCPICGVEDIKSSQFCRACGAELLVVRTALEQRADTGPIEANSAREQIGRALADKINQFESAADLRIVIHEILPVVERLLETPQDKQLRNEQEQLESEQSRLRRARISVVTGVLGLGDFLLFSVAGLASRNTDWFFLAVPGIIVFLIGIAILVNALYLTTLPVKTKNPGPSLFPQRVPDALPASFNKKEPDTADPLAISSVTEGTTRQL
jgi:hypothetical protein